ncbi:DinB family protein [Larkinella soli]|uniref:DinB family protein n=1 Tax=Larkinella soli TaxID=1770527 RepID=UPI000FFCB4CC|nr:DinB family protein [Larkinella soli]
MRHFQTNDLLAELNRDTRELIRIAREELAPLSDADLNRRPSPDGWSIAQCLEHLNSYGDYYLPRLEEALRKGVERQISFHPEFRSGRLGHYFAESMRPNADGSIGLKMKAFKNHRPAPELDARAVLASFLNQQQQLLDLLRRAGQTDMSRLRIPISIARWVRISAGDTFRFLIAHEQRHLVQARRVVEYLKSSVLPVA